MSPRARRLWRLAAMFAVMLGIARVFGVNAYASVGAAIIMGGMLWFVASFFYGVWKGWKG